LPKARQSDVLARLELHPSSYALVTLHRPSNVDDPTQLRMLLDVLVDISRRITVVFPVHPRTNANIAALIAPTDLPDRIKFVDPVGYVDFLALMQSSAFVLTDSGGIQEETTALAVPCITARTTTERPVTAEIGSNMLVPPTAHGILDAVTSVLDGRIRTSQVPPLWDGQAAHRIASIITSQCL
jgi:UDP-N-acetylglucosamine 2-epimerase (non-hydrolysing)